MAGARCRSAALGVDFIPDVAHEVQPPEIAVVMKLRLVWVGKLSAVDEHHVVVGAGAADSMVAGARSRRRARGDTKPSIGTQTIAVKIAVEKDLSPVVMLATKQDHLGLRFRPNLCV
eukprot:SAG11_NODE_290_length_11190_cov_12.004872_6_plen_117_part_00